MELPCCGCMGSQVPMASLAQKEMQRNFSPHPGSGPSLFSALDCACPQRAEREVQNGPHASFASDCGVKGRPANLEKAYELPLLLL